MFYKIIKHLTKSKYQRYAPTAKMPIFTQPLECTENLDLLPFLAQLDKRQKLFNIIVC